MLSKKIHRHKKKQLMIKLSFFVVALIMAGCEKKPAIAESQFIEEPVAVIKPVPNQNYEQYDLSDVLDSVKFVRLELSRESLIGNIDKVIVFQDRIYVLDRQTNSLFAFTMNGQYISKISSVGNGPGEYIQLDFFDIDYENSQIILTDLMGYWIFRYDLEGNYISRQKIPFWIEGVTSMPNQGFAVYANHRGNTHKFKNEFNLFYLDSAMQISKAYFPYNSAIFNNPRISFATSQTGTFYTYNKDRYFFSPFKDHVYQVTKDGLRPKYRFDFGEKTFDEKYLSRKSELKNYMEKGDFFQLANILENDDFVIFSFYQASVRIGYMGFYSKHSKKIICSPGFTVKGDSFHGNNITAYDSWIVAAFNPADLLSWSASIDKKKSSLDSEYAKLKKSIAEKVTMEDNQVLMFYKLRSF